MLLLTFLLTVVISFAALKILIRQEDEALHMTAQLDALSTAVQQLGQRVDAFVAKSAQDGAMIANLTSQTQTLNSQVASLTAERDALQARLAATPATDSPDDIQRQVDAVSVIAAKIPA
jgi:outer membrane murein-binding lipoprotein Lpp